MMDRTEFERAIEVFVQGFCFAHSLTHPAKVERVEDLWVVRDAPRRRPGDCRVEHWITFDADPADVVRRVRQHAGVRYSISAFRRISQPAEPWRTAYKQLGYRLVATEPLFVHRLKRIPRCECDAQIVAVTTRELDDQYARDWRHRPLPDALLSTDAPCRQYLAREGSDIVGAVHRTDFGAAHWVSHMLVLRLHRRRGIGKALLCRLLRDARERGSDLSVLLSSHTGAKLYPVVGYEQIGELMLFKPRGPRLTTGVSGG